MPDVLFVLVRAGFLLYLHIQKSTGAKLAIFKTGNGEWTNGNGERGTGNGRMGTGNGERGTGNL